MEVGAGGASGAAAQSHDLPALHLVPFFYFELGKVEVEGEESLAVVDDDAVAFEIEETGQQHRTRIHGGDGSSSGDAEIESPMGALSVAIEDALRTVDVGDGGYGWGSELAIPLAVRRDPAQVVLLDLHAFCDLLLLLGARFGEFLFDGEFHFNLRILGVSDGEGAREGQWTLAGRGLRGKYERVFAGTGFERYASQGEPGFGGCVVTESEWMGEPCAREGFQFGGRRYLKKNWSAVEQARGLGLDGPGSGR